MPQIGPLEILVVFVVALLVFGPKEIPKVARQLAKGWREVQRFQTTLRRDLDEVLREADEEEPDVTPAPVLPPKQVEAKQVEAKQVEAKPGETKPPDPSVDTPPDPAS